MQGEDKAAGGHLEEGTVVAYRGELAVMKCNDAPLRRIKNEKGVPILRSNISELC
jgi:predicted DNA-binding protein with PD1-like motif